MKYFQITNITDRIQDKRDPLKNSTVSFKTMEGMIPVVKYLLPGEVAYFAGNDILPDIRSLCNRTHVDYFEISKATYEKRQKEEKERLETIKQNLEESKKQKTTQQPKKETVKSSQSTSPKRKPSTKKTDSEAEDSSED